MVAKNTSAAKAKKAPAKKAADKPTAHERAIEAAQRVLEKADGDAPQGESQDEGQGDGTLPDPVIEAPSQLPEGQGESGEHGEGGDDEASEAPREEDSSNVQSAPSQVPDQERAQEEVREQAERLNEEAGRTGVDLEMERNGPTQTLDELDAMDDEDNDSDRFPRVTKDKKPAGVLIQSYTRGDKVRHRWENGAVSENSAHLSDVR